MCVKRVLRYSPFQRIFAKLNTDGRTYLRTDRQAGQQTGGQTLLWICESTSNKAGYTAADASSLLHSPLSASSRETHPFEFPMTLSTHCARGAIEIKHFQIGLPRRRPPPPHPSPLVTLSPGPHHLLPRPLDTPRLSI